MSKPTSISEINDKYDYTDDFPGGKHDAKYVSCGQKGTYNELKTAYETKLKDAVDDNDITKQQAIDILASACSTLDNPRLRTDFYAHIDKKLKALIDG